MKLNEGESLYSGVAFEEDGRGSFALTTTVAGVSGEDDVCLPSFIVIVAAVLVVIVNDWYEEVPHG